MKLSMSFYNFKHNLLSFFDIWGSEICAVVHACKFPMIELSKVLWAFETNFII